ncbi:MAG: hypothetical protein IT581_04945 [Verrucomicrobiales bacterium]|nr:hypothetical protein [Verrucomicrobiales bacterium]
MNSRTDVPLGRRIKATLAAVAACAAWPAIAGGPIVVCDTGLPLVWPSGGVQIPFNPDIGKLGPVSHDDAVALVTAAFGVWENVPSSTVTFTNAGELPLDVDVTNFVPFLYPAAPDGLSAIVFDDTGEIFDLLFGPNSGILGFAGPEWLNPSDCTILEGVCFLNGPAFTDSTYASDVMVHEFGHYTGLAHTVVNGQLGLGDTSGPTPDSATFGTPALFTDIVETMYPFYFGPGIGTSTLEADDIAMVSTLYPESTFKAGSGSIQGTIHGSIGLQKLSGVNVIARNLDNPFEDAVSAISGDFSVSPSDAYAGTYTLNGLKPGANYAVFIDQILAGGFSTAPSFLPGPEEFYSGASEGSSNLTDPPSAYAPVSPVAGTTLQGIDITINAPSPGETIPLADDGSLEIALPFPFTLCQETYNSVFVNANGSLTFGQSDGSPSPTPDRFLGGPPRVAALWMDLNPEEGGRIFFSRSADVFSVTWERVPEYHNPAVTVTMTLKLYRTGNRIDLQFGSVTAKQGITGVGCSACLASGSETQTDLSASVAKKSRMSLFRQPAIYEVYGPGHTFDLSSKTVLFQATSDYTDAWAGSNNSIANAKPITLPFSSAGMPYFTEIAPVGADVDYFRFHLNVGDRLDAKILGACFITKIALFSPSGSLVAQNNEDGAGALANLSHVASESGHYALAVSDFGDTPDYSGHGTSGGRYVMSVSARYCPPPSPPGPANWLVNGSFETGNLNGWSAGDTALPLQDWAVTDDQGVGFFSFVVPQDGCFALSNGFDGEGPMESFLFQDVQVPAALASLTLDWKDHLQWDLLSFGATLSRTYSVQIIDPMTSSVLATVFSMPLEVGTVVDTGWVDHSVDLSAFIGQSIRIQFLQEIPELFSGPGQYELDDVRLRSN